MAVSLKQSYLPRVVYNKAPEWMKVVNDYARTLQISHVALAVIGGLSFLCLFSTSLSLAAAVGGVVVALTALSALMCKVAIQYFTVRERPYPIAPPSDLAQLPTVPQNVGSSCYLSAAVMALLAIPDIGNGLAARVQAKLQENLEQQGQNPADIDRLRDREQRLRSLGAYLANGDIRQIKKLVAFTIWSDAEKRACLLEFARKLHFEDFKKEQLDQLAGPEGDVLREFHQTQLPQCTPVFETIEIDGQKEEQCQGMEGPQFNSASLNRYFNALNHFNLAEEYRQRDASEVLLHLLSCLSELGLTESPLGCHRYDYKTVEDLVTGERITRLFGPKINLLHTLILPFPQGTNSLQTAVEDHFIESVNSDPDERILDNGVQKRLISERPILSAPPAILPIQISRFERVNGVPRKIHALLEGSDQLILPKETTLAGVEAHYRLDAFIYHDGGMDSGHYYICARGGDGRFYELNDVAHPREPREISHEEFLERAKTCYIPIYSRFA